MGNMISKVFQWHFGAVVQCFLIYRFQPKHSDSGKKIAYEPTERLDFWDLDLGGGSCFSALSPSGKGKCHWRFL